MNINGTFLEIFSSVVSGPGWSRRSRGAALRSSRRVRSALAAFAQRTADSASAPASSVSGSSHTGIELRPVTDLRQIIS